MTPNALFPASTRIVNALASPSYRAPLRKPESTTENVFMEQALAKLAIAEFGNKWTGEEPTIRLPELLPDALHPHFSGLILNALMGDISNAPAQWFDHPSRAVLERADDLLAVHRPELNRLPRRPGIFGLGASRPLSFTYLEWTAAQEVVQKIYDECLESITRWLELQKVFVSLCERGKLKIVLRGLGGGDFSEAVPRSQWRLENYLLRFISFQMDPGAPFDGELWSAGNKWIFVTADSLKAVLSEYSRVVVSNDEHSPYESELLQHMRRVSLAVEMSAENPPKKSVVEAMLRQMWQSNKPLSNRDVETMASHIRPLASREGMITRKSRKSVPTSE